MTTNKTNATTTKNQPQILSGITLDFEDSLFRDTAYYSLLGHGFSTRSLPGCGLVVDVREGDDAIQILGLIAAALVAHPNT